MQFLGIYAAEDLGFWKGAFVHEHKREALAVLRAHFPQSA
jgi:hypothetical protein